jgi:hypothetical protein
VEQDEEAQRVSAFRRTMFDIRSPRGGAIPLVPPGGARNFGVSRARPGARNGSHAKRRRTERNRGASRHRWRRDSLLTDSYYAVEDGAWTVFAQGEDLASGCGYHAYETSVRASLKESSYTAKSATLTAQIARTYDEEGPLRFEAGLLIGLLPGALPSPSSPPWQIPSPVMVSLTSASPSQSPALNAGETVLVGVGARKDVSLHEPIFFELLIENRSTRGLGFDLGSNLRGNLRVEMVRPDGSTRVVRLPTPDGMSIKGTVALRPLDVYAGEYVLNDWVDFDQPGAYAVHLQIESPFQAGDGTTWNNPGVITFNFAVGDRNGERLRAVCQHLAQVASGRESAARSINAARALTYVFDDIAVAAMGDVVRASNLSDFVIAHGLARIGTPSARTLLNEMASSQEQERAAIARDALRRGR